MTNSTMRRPQNVLKQYDKFLEYFLSSVPCWSPSPSSLSQSPPSDSKHNSFATSSATSEREPRPMTIRQYNNESNAENRSCLNSQRKENDQRHVRFADNPITMDLSKELAALEESSQEDATVASTVDGDDTSSATTTDSIRAEEQEEEESIEIYCESESECAHDSVASTYGPDSDACVAEHDIAANDGDHNRNTGRLSPRQQDHELKATRTSSLVLPSDVPQQIVLPAGRLSRKLIFAYMHCSQYNVHM